MAAPDGFALRRASVADAGTVADLHVRSWRSAYRDFLPADYLAGLDPAAHAAAYWTPALAREVGRPMAYTRLATVGGVPTGFVSIEGPDGVPPPEEALPGHGYVHHIHVAPERVGTGVGAALWRDALGALAAAGLERGTLAVYEPNARARAFYERMGWRADGWSMGRAFPSAGGGVTVSMLRYAGPTVQSGGR